MLSSRTSLTFWLLLAFASLGTASADELMLTGGPDLSVSFSQQQNTLFAGFAGRIWSVDAHGGTASPLTDSSLTLSKPKVSKDGRFVVAVGGPGSDVHNLWLIDTRDGETRRITNGRWRDDDPVWHPTEAAVVFASDRSGSWQLWKISVLDGLVQRLTVEPGYARDPTFSVDGQALLYVQTLPDRYELRQRYGRGRPFTLLQSRSPIRYPSARPQGALLTYWAMEQDGQARLEMLLPTESPIIKAVPDTPKSSPQSLIWKDRDHYFLANGGRLSLQTFATPDQTTVPLTGWLSVARAKPLPLQPKVDTTGPRFVLRVGYVLDLINNRRLERQDLLIDAGRIAAIVPRRPWPDETIIDLDGTTVMPRLIDIDLIEEPTRQQLAGGIVSSSISPERVAVPGALEHNLRTTFIKSVSPDAMIVSDRALPDLLSGVHVLELDIESANRHEELILASATNLRVKTAGILEPGTDAWAKLSASRLYAGANQQSPAADRTSLPPSLHSRIITGSKGGAMRAPLGLHSNLMALNALGVSPGETLASATWRPASLLGLTDRGLVEQGHIADLLMVDGNPLADLSVLLSPVAIVNDGVFKSVGGLLDP